MRGLLIDIERKHPDVSRYDELRNGIVHAASLNKNWGKSISVVLDHIHFTDIYNYLNILHKYDFLILSPQGSPWGSYRGKDMDSLNFLAQTVCGQILEKRSPTLGICGGHQFLAMAFGGEIGFIDNSLANFDGDCYPPNCLAERGPTIIRTLRDDPIFDGITDHPGHFSVIENHVEEVKTAPPGFMNLASSDLSRIQLMRLPDRIVYGVAFHPERGWSHRETNEASLAPHGKRILANFLKMAYAVKYRVSFV
ncbi:MAG: gamma-glutamyl-gamma-aminobutyrate hydrolase family protein [Deltaproteobacteria bacterium]|nr:gamma-glutamyl-gamma-aminobutyrate hydrolase family protein [Deltaproteobacteria bacterium]